MGREPKAVNLSRFHIPRKISVHKYFLLECFDLNIKLTPCLTNMKKLETIYKNLKLKALYFRHF